MNTIKIITPTNIEVEYKLAGVGARLAAATLDLLIQFSIILAVVIVFISIESWLTNLGVSVDGGVIAAILILLVFVINFGYFMVNELVTRGQSIGKRAFGLRVLRDNGQPIEFTQVLVRGILRSTIDIMYVGVFTIFFSKRHKRLGDMAAGTIVVIEKLNEEYEQPLTATAKELPDFLPPTLEMTPEQRSVVEAWHRRQNTLPNKGQDFALRLKNYFTALEEKKCKDADAAEEDPAQ